ncbi:glucuronosyltransferase [Erythrobacter sp. Alg231-14]|uniref:glucuronosyltransferase n=1 Tax=Erythrobacter sp. Alg231-14 TaxID=1922225 RepID=UPI00307B9EEC
MTKPATNPSRRVLAVASGGGHWEQLMLLRPVLEQYDLRFATTDADIAHQRGITTIDTLPDCNQNKPIQSLLCTFVAAWIVLKHRPHIVLSTGAAPGFFCLMAGRLIGARTLWIDSVANGEQLSMCGKLSRRLAHQCLTQWPELADEPRVKYRGAVL